MDVEVFIVVVCYEFVDVDIIEIYVRILFLKEVFDVYDFVNIFGFYYSVDFFFI